jgi:hypothetical protein
VLTASLTTTGAFVKEIQRALVATLSTTAALISEKITQEANRLLIFRRRR